MQKRLCEVVRDNVVQRVYMSELVKGETFKLYEPDETYVGEYVALEEPIANPESGIMGVLVDVK